MDDSAFTTGGVPIFDPTELFATGANEEKAAKREDVPSPGLERASAQALLKERVHR